MTAFQPYQMDIREQSDPACDYQGHERTEDQPVHNDSPSSMAFLPRTESFPCPVSHLTFQSPSHPSNGGCSSLWRERGNRRRHVQPSVLGESAASSMAASIANRRIKEPGLSGRRFP